jgi:hypothetical protein
LAYQWSVSGKVAVIDAFYVVTVSRSCDSLTAIGAAAGEAQRALEEQGFRFEELQITVFNEVVRDAGADEQEIVVKTPEVFSPGFVVGVPRTGEWFSVRSVDGPRLHVVRGYLRGAARDIRCGDELRAEINVRRT